MTTAIMREKHDRSATHTADTKIQVTNGSSQNKAPQAFHNTPATPLQEPKLPQTYPKRKDNIF
jgi:hypothetical protein